MGAIGNLQFQILIIMNRITFFSILLAVGLSACTKEIDIDLNSESPEVVIQGNISDESGPYTVTIEKTVNFSEPNVYPPVQGAWVTISDNRGVVDTLQESMPGVYITSKIQGTPGTTYRLNVRAEGKSYEAWSTMPIPVNFDSLAFSPVARPGADKLFAAWPQFFDPPVQGNYYRFIQTVNSKTDQTFYVTNDNVANGIKNPRPLFSPDTEIKSGDTVVVEMRCLDLPSYTYFFALSQMTGGGPGVTPSNPPSNISGNNTLGHFSAFTRQIKTRIAP